MKLYGHPISGNAHRVQTLLSVLGVDHEYITVKMMEGEHKQPEFLSLNPLGQIPVLVDGDLVLRDSIAIMTYLARKYDTKNSWLPTDAKTHAQVQQWLSTVVNEIQAGPFTLRAIKLFGASSDADLALAKTKNIFDNMFEPHLQKQDWLVDNKPTLADLACYACIARVTEGDFSLEAYPAIRKWLERIEKIDGFVPMMKAGE